MEEQKRYKAVIARATEWHTECPYKGCQVLIKLSGAHKGDILTCYNCRKQFKIKKVVI